MKTITFTDDELEAVRRAVAALAGKDEDGRHLRSALVKLDRGTDARKIEIVVDDPKKGSFPAFVGVATRWRKPFDSIVSAAQKRGGRVTVFVDGVEVDGATLKVNEVFP